MLLFIQYLNQLNLYWSTILTFSSSAYDIGDINRNL